MNCVSVCPSVSVSAWTSASLALRRAFHIRQMRASRRGNDAAGGGAATPEWRPRRAASKWNRFVQRTSIRHTVTYGTPRPHCWRTLMTSAGDHYWPSRRPTVFTLHGTAETGRVGRSAYLVIRSTRHRRNRPRVLSLNTDKNLTLYRVLSSYSASELQDCQ